LLKKLDLDSNEVVVMWTEKIFGKYDKNYYDLFKV
jgi:hypothetical protein